MVNKDGYERLLVPVDGSDAAMAALEEAMTLADRLNATIHSLYAIDPRRAHGFTTEDLVIAALEDEGEATMADVRERCQARGVPVETTVERGHPSDVILDYATDKGMDLIVLATHGRRGLDRFLLGSVAEHVIRHAEVPVLTVRAAAEK